MKDRRRLGCVDHAVEGLAVADVYDLEVCLSGDIVGVSGGEIVDDERSPSLREQRVDCMGADEASSSRDDR